MTRKEGEKEEHFVLLAPHFFSLNLTRARPPIFSLPCPPNPFLHQFSSHLTSNPTGEGEREHSSRKGQRSLFFTKKTRAKKRERDFDESCFCFFSFSFLVNNKLGKKEFVFIRKPYLWTLVGWSGAWQTFHTTQKRERDQFQKALPMLATSEVSLRHFEVKIVGLASQLHV